ncbi:hypothetical protein HHK36_004499 [Tetracentron sinense]|uniref:Prolamin-like domain-containing protein n=1 Tax=Tetracentron sinense TaxID=13715 RepID=A0A834ZRA3_TETSI|nr:hypothetical protein HHK36_004499 [Tetracentron sinense]
MSFIVALIATLVAAGLARLQPGEPAIIPVAGPESQKCWSSLQSIDGCVLEIFRSFSSGKMVPIGPACCNAVIGVSDNCWPKMFPVEPSFPTMLKKYCHLAPVPSPSVRSVWRNAVTTRKHL